MSWRYAQATGDLVRVVEGLDAIVIAGAGYSGHGEGLNAPELEHVKSVGPIPRGLWHIGPPYDSSNVGPYALPLYFVFVDVFGHATSHAPGPYGREEFRIHGDNYARNRSASHGCIVLPRKLREYIHESADNVLEVVAR